MDRHLCAVVDIASGPLDPAAALDFVSDPGFGGITMFVGRVRDLNHGRAVTGVSYDMSDTIALGVELGLRYQGKPGAEPLFADPQLRNVNNTGSRWSLPISVFAKARF